MEYRYIIKTPKHIPVWIKYFFNEIGRLAQAVNGRLEGIDTIFFLPHNNIPKNKWKDVTYGQIVVDHRPQKD